MYELQQHYVSLMVCIPSKILRMKPLFFSDTYFPLSAVMYSSQDIVFGDGGVRDCLLAG